MARLGIAHRDLKPENVLLDHNNNVKIVDFGLSNFYAKGQKLQTACGSPCYAAPEMIRGQPYDGKASKLGLKADIWSLGIILYAIMVGTLPFDDPNTQTLYRKILSGQFYLPSLLSSESTNLLKGILNVDPDQRYLSRPNNVKVQGRRHPQECLLSQELRGSGAHRHLRGPGPYPCRR